MTRAFQAFAGVVVLIVSFPLPPAAAAADIPRSKGRISRIQFDQNLHTRIVARFDWKETPLGPFTASEILAHPRKI